MISQSQTETTCTMKRERTYIICGIEHMCTAVRVHRINKDFLLSRTIFEWIIEQLEYANVRSILAQKFL